MPIVILVIAVFLVAAGLNNRLPQLIGLLSDDIAPSESGQISFVWWVASIVLLGALGYVKVLKPFSNAFLALVFLALLLANQTKSGGGFFTQLQAAFGNLATPQPVTPASGGNTGSLTQALNLSGTSTLSAADLLNLAQGSANSIGSNLGGDFLASIG